MKEYSSDKIRNVAVVSHDGAGKTALVESLLLTSGAVDFVGKGQDNKHIMDFEPEDIHIMRLNETEEEFDARIEEYVEIEEQEAGLINAIEEERDEENKL